MFVRMRVCFYLCACACAYVCAHARVYNLTVMLKIYKYFLYMQFFFFTFSETFSTIERFFKFKESFPKKSIKLHSAFVACLCQFYFQNYSVRKIIEKIPPLLSTDYEHFSLNCVHKIRFLKEILQFQERKAPICIIPSSFPGDTIIFFYTFLSV